MEELGGIYCPGCGEQKKVRKGVFTGFSCACGWEANVILEMKRTALPDSEIRAFKRLVTTKDKGADI